MRRAAKLLILGVVAAIATVNAVAFMQARAMTQFTSGGPRTKRPERLGMLEAARVVAFGVNVPRPENRRAPGELGLPFEVHRFASGHGPTIEAWYVPSEPARPTVLVFHGYAGSKSTLLPIARALHDLGYSALLVDFYGSGGSSGSGTTLGRLEGEDVAAALAYAEHAWPERGEVLYGFSMGGAAILRAVAAEGVRPRKIIIEATFDTLLETARSRFHTMGLPATPFAQLLLFWGGLQWGFDAFSHNPVDYARSVRCPVLVLQGDRDARVSVQQAQSLTGAIRNARLVLFPGVPHTLAVKVREDDWKREVGDFLARPG